MFESLHKYRVTLNNNLTLFQPNVDILFSQNLFETLKIDTLLTFNVLSMNIKSLLSIYFDADILSSLTLMHSLGIEPMTLMLRAGGGV